MSGGLSPTWLTGTPSPPPPTSGQGTSGVLSGLGSFSGTPITVAPTPTNTGQQQLVNTPFNAQSQAPAPQTASDWAVAILYALGIEPSPGRVQALVAQMRLEDNTLTYLTGKNNPLAVTNANYASASPLPNNSAGVQQYGDWIDGLAATVTDIQANPGLIAELQSGGVTCASYAVALKGATWEGYQSAPNQQYGANVGNLCNQKPPGLSSAWADYINSRSGAVIETGLSAALGKVQSGVDTAAKAVASGTGFLRFLDAFAAKLGAIGWAGLASIVIGFLLIGAGLLFIFRDSFASVVKSLPTAAAAAG